MVRPLKLNVFVSWTRRWSRPFSRRFSWLERTAWNTHRSSYHKKIKLCSVYLASLFRLQPKGFIFFPLVYLQGATETQINRLDSPTSIEHPSYMPPLSWYISGFRSFKQTPFSSIPNFMKYSVFAFFPFSDQVVIVPEMLKYKDNIMNKK